MQAYSIWVLARVQGSKIRRTYIHSNASSTPSCLSLSLLRTRRTAKLGKILRTSEKHPARIDIPSQAKPYQSTHLRLEFATSATTASASAAAAARKQASFCFNSSSDSNTQASSPP